MTTVADRYPKFAGGFVVIDSRDAPRLANAIGCKIYLRRSAADARLASAKQFRTDADYLHVVPVVGKNDVFALPALFCDDVIIDDNGQIRMAR